MLPASHARKRIFQDGMDYQVRPFDSEPWPNGRDNEPLARVDLKLLPSTLLPKVSERRPDGSLVLLSPRCDLIRRPIRSNEWPMLFPEEYLNRAPSEVLRLCNEGNSHR